MRWSEIREFGDRQIEISIDGDITVDASGAFGDASRERLFVVDVIESAVAEVAIVIAQQMAAAREALGAYSDVSRPQEPLLPWLRTGRGNDLPVAPQVLLGALRDCFDVHTPLVGQRCDRVFSLGAFSVSTSRDLDARAIHIAIHSIELGEGSIKAKLKVVLSVTVATLTLTFAAFATPLGQEKFDQWRFQQKVERVVQGQRCETLSDFGFDLRSLRERTIEELNYKAPGLNDAEYAVRVCSVQLALALEKGIPVLIDGKAGTKTQEALAYFASLHGLPADITDSRLRAELVQILQGSR